MNRFLFEDDELTQDPMAASGGGSLYEPKPQVKAEVSPALPVDDIEELKRKAQSKKSWLNAGSGIANALLNTRNTAEIMLGQGRPNNDYGATFRQAAEGVKDPEEQRAKALQYLKLKQDLAKQERENAQSDADNNPESPESVAFAETIGNLMPSLRSHVSGKSKRVLQEAFPVMAAKIQGDNSRENARIAAGLQAQNRADRLDEKHRVETDKYVEKFQGKIAPLQNTQDALAAVEQKLGFQLSAYDPKTSTAVKDDGTRIKVDLPGVSVPGFGRLTAHDTDARVLNDTISKVFNVELRDRSGAAVTTPELERLRSEFSAGKFNTESELIGALNQYKKAATKAMQNVEAGYDPKVVDTYQERGGMTSKTVAPQKVVVKQQKNKRTGETRVVYSDGTSEVISSSARY